MKKNIYYSFLAFSLGSFQAANASGFLVYEQNASMFGTGYAGAVTAINDPSTIFYNPAGLTRLEGTQATTVANFLFPKSDFRDDGSRVILNGTTFPIAGKQRSNGGDMAFVPNFYASHQLNDQFYLGFGVSAPFGLKTEYDKNWVGRYIGIKSDLKTIVMNPTIAFKVDDKFSIGGGIVVQYGDADLTSAIDFGGLAAASVPLANIPANIRSTAVPGGADGMFRLKGDAWSLGFNLGATYKPFDGTTLGVSFRSSTASTIKGKATFTNTPVGQFLSDNSGRFRNTSAKADLNTPEMLIFGIHQRLTDDWRVMADAAWTNWCRFEELRLRFANPREVDLVDEENWKSSWRFALGTEYDVLDGLTLKLGGGIDNSPVPNRTRSPNIPDADRTFITAGATYKHSDMISASIGYGHFFFDKAPIDLTRSVRGLQQNWAANVKGRIKAAVDIINAQITFRF